MLFLGASYGDCRETEVSNDRKPKTQAIYPVICSKTGVNLSRRSEMSVVLNPSLREVAFHVGLHFTSAPGHFWILLWR